MTATSPFEDDIRAAQAAADRSRIWGGLAAFFTLGIYDNRDNITRAERHIADAQRDNATIREALRDIARMRQFLDADILDHGVRVACCAFPDVALDGTTTYGPFWQSIRLEVLQRDGYQCQHPGACAGPLQIHHMRPLSKGGTNDLRNLITLCRYHHGLEHPGNPYFRR